MKRLPSPRGFTLIELMVALGMALAVTTAALTVMLLVIDTQREGQRRNAMSRDAQLAMDTIAYDLGFLGVGVPRGYEADEDGNVIGTINDAATAARQLRPAVRIARSDYLAFLGDLPYPNADLNGIAQPSMLKDNPPNPKDRKNALSVSSALSGCAPGSGSNYVCDTTKSTLPVGGSNCSTGGNGEPSCPWGLRKWAAPNGELNLVFGSHDGRWWRRQVNTSGHVPNTITDSERKMIQLTSVGGSDKLPVNAFVGIDVGGGFIAQLDRVFYSVENADGSAPCTTDCVLRRKQCWHWDIASTHPNTAGFPERNGTPQTSGSGSIPDCNEADSEGTPWEPILEGLENLEFQYFDANGDPLTATDTDPAELARVRTVRVVLDLKRELNRNKELTYTLSRQFHLDNAGGIVSIEPPTDEANGGCWAVANGGPANECNPQ